MDCSMPGFPVLHYLPESAQIHVHWVSDVIQPSHPLSSPSPPALNLSQHKVFSNELALHIRQPIIGNSTSASVFPMNIQVWFPLGFTGLVSLLFKGLSRVFSSTTVWKHQFFGTQPSLWSNSSSMTTGKTIALMRRTFVSKVMSLLFNMLYRFVIAFPPRSKHLLISGLQSSPTVTLEPKKTV